MANQLVCDCDVMHEEIVNKVKDSMIEKDKFNKLASLYKMFSDSTRVQILWALNQNEMCVCDLAVLLNMTKSAVSHQLKSLRISNLVKFQKKGKVVWYSLADDHVKEILEMGIEHINE